MPNLNYFGLQNVSNVVLLLLQIMISAVSFRFNVWFLKTVFKQEICAFPVIG